MALDNGGHVPMFPSSTDIVEICDKLSCALYDTRLWLHIEQIQAKGM